MSHLSLAPRRTSLRSGEDNLKMANTNEMRANRARLIEQAREIQNRAEQESRVMNAEEREQWDRLMDDAEEIRESYERMERMEAAQASLEEGQETRRDMDGRRVQTPRQDVGRPSRADAAVRGVATNDDALLALQAWLIHGSEKQAPQHMIEAARRCGVDVYQKSLTITLPEKALGRSGIGVRHGKPTVDIGEVDRWGRANRELVERRQQSVGVGSEGGFTVADEMIRELEVALLAFGGMRQAAQVFRTTTGADLPWPDLDDTSQEGEIVGENLQVNQQDLTFGQTVLNAFKYSSKMIKVSVEFLQDSSINVAQVIGEALGTRIGRVTNRHFTTGTGSGQPRGIVTAAVSDVTLGGLLGDISYDEIVDIEHSVDPEYRVNASWMFNDLTLRQIKKLRDDSGATAGTGRPLWLPGLVQGEPDTILGYPFIINQAVPLLSTPSAKSVVFGDLSKYKIRDVREVTLLRLDERFAEFHQVAFLAFSRHDGDIINAGTNPVKAATNPAS